MSMNQFDEQVAKKALALPEQIAGLDCEGDDGLRMYHLLRSLIEYCDAQNPRIGFDEIVSNVRDDFQADA